MNLESIRKVWGSSSRGNVELKKKSREEEKHDSKKTLALCQEIYRRGFIHVHPKNAEGDLCCGIIINLESIRMV